MIHFLVPAAQDLGIRDYLDVWGAALRENFRVVHYENLVRQKEFARGTYVLSALDQLSPAMLALVFELQHQLIEHEAVRFLNNATKTLRRFELLTELHRQELNEFRVGRAEANANGLKFPVFLRNERQHEGALSTLLRSEREIQQAIGRALVQGHKVRDLLLVEFCDTADEKGYYRKYAAFVVGKKVIPRSLNYGRDWMLKHSQTEFTLPMVHEELEYVSQNPHRQQLLNIFEMAQVEYGRIDYAIKNGRVQTWEINLNPTIGRGLRPRSMNIAPEADAIRDQVRHCFYQAFENAWKEVQVRTDDQTAIEVKISSKIIEAASANGVRENRLLPVIRSIVRPLKTFIEPLSPPFLAALARLVRVFQRNGSCK